MKPSRGLGVQGKQTLSQAVFLVILGGRGLFNDRNPGALCQTAHGGWKIEMLVFHHKSKHAASRAASEAVVILPRGVHMEGWGLLLMERAERTEARSRALERKIRADQINDVVRIADALDCFLGDESHNLKIPCGVSGREGDLRRYEVLSLSLCLYRRSDA